LINTLKRKGHRTEPCGNSKSNNIVIMAVAAAIVVAVVVSALTVELVSAVI
jgi:hypothetical protein